MSMTEQAAREKAKALRLELEATGRYGPVDSLDPHDGSVQQRVDEIIAAALLTTDREARADERGKENHITYETFRKDVLQPFVDANLVDPATGGPRRVLGRAEHLPMCNTEGRTYVTFGLKAGEHAVHFAASALAARGEVGNG